MRQAVVIAKGDQWPDFKFEKAVSLRSNLNRATFVLRLRLWAWAASYYQLVLNYYRILPLNHEDRLLDLDSLNLEGEHREWIQPKAGLILKALGMNYAGILIRRQLVVLAVEHQCLFEFREQQYAAYRRDGRSCEQPMVTTRVDTNDSGR